MLLENFETDPDENKLREKIDLLIEQIEMSEMDLLNKNISDETIERQKDILTRILDAENALEQRGEDDKRRRKQHINTNFLFQRLFWRI